MSRVFLSLLMVLVLTQGLCAQTNYGVDAQERVVRLPEDGLKWHLSVVGQDTQYREVLGWFDIVPNLKALKSKVLFHQVTPSDPIYSERYAPNIKALPTVRLQDERGVVIFEAAGKNLPMTGEGLYAAIASAVNGSEELLPWRRKNRQPAPSPQPDPVPDTDPAPQPLDNGGAPALEPVDEYPITLIVACIALLVGSIVGQVQASKKYHSGIK